MSLAKKYAVPRELALLYEFVNSLDLRSYVEKGQQHFHSDQLESPVQLTKWMRERGLLRNRESVSVASHRRALALRNALRSFLKCPPDSRRSAIQQADELNRVSGFFPLIVRIDQAGNPTLQPGSNTTGLGQVLAEFIALAETQRLDRLKMCSAEECQWIYFDRSKPGNRIWCSPLLCGNRHKTRDYRRRVKVESSTLAFKRS